MGFMSQRYVPHCCLVYLTEKENYLSKIIKCDEELILTKFKNINLFRHKIQIGQLSEKDISYMKEVKMETKFTFGNVNQ